MTVIFTIFGMLIFAISFTTAGFATAFKRLLLMIATGVCIDVAIVLIAVGAFNMTI